MSGTEESFSAEAFGPGAMLARERKAQGLALADVAGRLKFSERQIETLEADDFAKTPGTVFLRGMIRSYARLLGIDSEPILKTLERCPIASPAEVELHTKRIPFPEGRTRSNRVYLGLSALLAIAVAVVLYEWYFGLPEAFLHFSAPEPKRSAEVVQLPAAPQSLASDARPAPVQSVADPAAGAGDAFGRILLEFQKESWVEIKDRAGVVLLSQINPAGSQRIVKGEPPFSLVIGNAGSVRLSYRNMPVDLTPHIKVEVARLTLE